MFLIIFKKVLYYIGCISLCIVVFLFTFVMSTLFLSLFFRSEDLP
jgi:hypothetical protein